MQAFGQSRKQATEAGRSSRRHRKGASGASHRTAVDPGNPFADGQLVQQIAGLKIVGSVENQVEAFHQLFPVPVVQVGHHSLSLYQMIDGPQFSFRSDGLGQVLRRVGFGEEHLALQVALFDVITIYNPQAPHPGTYQGIGLRGAQGAAADDHHARAFNPPLPFFPDLRKKDLA